MARQLEQRRPFFESDEKGDGVTSGRHHEYESKTKELTIHLNRDFLPSSMLSKHILFRMENGKNIMELFR